VGRDFRQSASKIQNLSQAAVLLFMQVRMPEAGGVPGFVLLSLCLLAIL